MANVLRWFIQDWADPIPEGLTQQEANQYKLDQAASRIVDMVRHEAQRVRLREILAEQSSAEETAANDVAL